MTSLLIRGGRIIDPANRIDRVGDLLIQDGRIAEIGAAVASADRLLDAEGCIVSPGFIDLHTALREPGYEKDESTESGTAAALAGGFTTIASMPDTQPVVDNRAAAEFVFLQAQRAGNCHVLPLGAVTRGHDGVELADLGQLVEGGAVGFTDGKKPLASAEVMRRALEYTRMFGKPILSHPQVPELVSNGVMHEGFYSTLLGLRGMPAAAEDIMVGRDIALANLTGGHVHLMCISSRHSVEQIRLARRHGIRVTADVTPHHLCLTDENLQTFDPNYKVDPPLRTQMHIEALIEGLLDDTIDAISSDHQPWASEKKDRELDLVPFGITSLETVLSVCATALIETQLLDWPTLIAKLTSGPAAVLDLDAGTLIPGRTADVTIIDPACRRVVDTGTFRSRSRNTPFHGRTLTGTVVATVVAGEVRYENRR